MIRYPPRSSANHAPHHTATYRLATLLTIPLILSILLFWIVTRGSTPAVIAWEILPQSYLFVLIVIFILPLQRLSRSGRYRFLATLKRVSVGGLAEPQDGKFGDILLADVLTSYAKIMGELFVSLCMFFSPGMSSTGKPNRACGGVFLVPFIISVPSLIRLRQCLIEFVRVQKGKQTSGGWGGQHLANALKYSSAFPVIFLSAMMRGYDPAMIGLSEVTLYRLWYFPLSHGIPCICSPSLGCYVYLQILCTHSIGMSPKIGTLPYLSHPNRALPHDTRHTLMDFDLVVIFTHLLCTILQLAWISCCASPGLSNSLPILIISTTSKAAYSQWRLWR